MSISSFPHNVFDILLLKGCQDTGLFCYLFTTWSRLLMPVRKKPFQDIVGKRTKCWLLAFLSFSTILSTLSRTESIILATMNLFVCLGFYTVSAVCQLFNGDSSQIHLSWSIFNQCLTNPLSWHSRASCSAVPTILSAFKYGQGQNLVVC